ncbi:MAG TPA: TerC family protein [Alphaproteobacteria bacterium]|nr:TerC family protein [Alphaproteobacteria bacterium]
MDWIADPQAWIAFVTLVALELVLGIDNVVFISILSERLPGDRPRKARLLGLSLAMLMRIGLLFSLTWIIGLTAPWVVLFGHELSGRDFILIGGGLFLLAKSTHEIHQKLEGAAGEASVRVAPSFAAVIVQILLLDIVFSLDSVLTAIGMVRQIEIMVAAVVIAVLFMMLFAGVIGDFVHRHPTLKMLALSFLLLIGVTLIADGFEQHIPRGYIYFAMGFSVFVEMLNLQLRKTRVSPVELRQPYTHQAGQGLTSEVH